ncbi:hypothetical protein [Candidatus Rariloculus sp.]|uniref:hypothetical protein n=1 Tax=Candidatus Rariloculus sp. TaxID=3101265 RepID=UPI003D146DC9
MWTHKTLTMLFLLSALSPMPFAVAHSQTIDNATVYALANQLADELELVRESMGAAYDDSPRLPVSAISQVELYFQTQLLLRKANQLAPELAGASPRPPGLVPSGEILPGDVHALLEDGLEQIEHVAEAIGIAEQVDNVPRGAPLSPTGVFLVVIDINRQLNHMLRVPISDADVFDEIALSVTYAASLLSMQAGAEPVPDAPPFDGYKRPADVYRRLTECIDVMIRVAERAGLQVAGLSSRRNIPDDITPGHILDVARIVTADLAALAVALNAPLVRPELPTPKHIFSTEVYANAGILLRQLEELERRL